jgi:hypothetical protein
MYSHYFTKMSGVFKRAIRHHDVLLMGLMLVYNSTVCLRFRRILDSGEKENAFSIVTEGRTYHVIAESAHDWK